MTWIKFIALIAKLRERCPLCLKRNEELVARLIDRESIIKAKELQLKLQQEVIDQYHVFIKEKELLFSKQEFFVSDQKRFIAEREMALDIREKNLMSEKEKMMDTDAIEIKRKILLPVLQEKWKAEAAKIDLERIKILQETPRIRGSLAARIAELEKIIDTIKGKPRNTSNNDLLVDAIARHDEIKRLIETLDKERISCAA